MITVVLTVFSGIVALWLGFWGISKASMETYYCGWTYYFLALSLILWIFATFRAFNNVYGNKISEKGGLLKVASEFFKKHKVAIGCAFALTILGSLACKPDFRVLADETNLISMAQALYEEKDCSNYTSVLYYYHGMKNIISKVTDMRPAFYPYVVSLLHSASGYRPENAFVVNIISGFLALLILYYLVHKKYGRFWGIMAMVALASFPTYVLCVNSAGFEVFNMLCSLILFILLIWFIKSPNAVTGEALLLWLPLLGQTRYESMAAVFCVLPVVFWLLPKECYKQFSYKLILWPWLFLPAAWLRVITCNESSFQVSDVNNAFSWELFVKNFKQAFPFFFGKDIAYGMVPAIASLAVAGVIWAAIECFMKKRCRSEKVFWTSTLLFYVLHAAIRFAYYWGDLTYRFTSRLGVIFMPLLVFLAISFLVKFCYFFPIKKAYIAVGMLAIPLWTWPVAGQNLGIRELNLFREYRSARDCLEAYFPKKDEYILVADRANLYTPLKYNAINFDHLRANLDSVLSNVNCRTYSYMVLLQAINTSSGTPTDECKVPDSLKLEKVCEFQVKAGQYIRVSKYIVKS